ANTYGVYARRYLNLPTGFAYDAATRILTITGTAGADSFVFSQQTALVAGNPRTTDQFTLNGVSYRLPDSVIASVVVNGNGGTDGGKLYTDDKYTGADGSIHETAEQAVLGTGGGVLQRFAADGNPFTFLTFNNYSNTDAYM